jgi:hypothetical protein
MEFLTGVLSTATCGQSPIVGLHSSGCAVGFLACGVCHMCECRVLFGARSDTLGQLPVYVFTRLCMYHQQQQFDALIARCLDYVTLLVWLQVVC